MAKKRCGILHLQAMMGMETTTTTSGARQRERGSARFRCLLDEQPAALLPQPAMRELRRLRPFTGLVLNPCCQFFSPELGRLPFLERFHSMRDCVWVLDPASDMLLPFELGPAFSRYLEGKRPGDPAPPDLPEQAAHILRYAGLLVPENYKPWRQHEGKKLATEWADFFRKNGYLCIEKLFHPFHIASLRSYYRELIDTGEFESGEDGDPSYIWMHNEVTTRFFHYQLTSTVSRIVGEPVQPSYAYVRRYRPGAELRKHVDREQCEFTVSLAVDFIPEPQTATEWPIYVETKKGAVAFRQALGDGLLFRGRELPHYRKRLPTGYTSTSVFFHFVPRGFTGELD